LRRRQCHLGPTNRPSNAALDLSIVLSVHVCCTFATAIMHTLRVLLLNAYAFTRNSTVYRCSSAAHVASQLCIHLVSIGHGKALQSLAHECNICILNLDTLPSLSCKLPHSPKLSCISINACWESAPMGHPCRLPIGCCV